MPIKGEPHRTKCGKDTITYVVEQCWYDFTSDEENSASSSDSESGSVYSSSSASTKGAKESEPRGFDNEKVTARKVKAQPKEQLVELNLNTSPRVALSGLIGFMYKYKNTIDIEFMQGLLASEMTLPWNNPAMLATKHYCETNSRPKNCGVLATQSSCLGEMAAMLPAGLCMPTEPTKGCLYYSPNGVDVVRFGSVRSTTRVTTYGVGEFIAIKPSGVRQPHPGQWALPTEKFPKVRAHGYGGSSSVGSRWKAGAKTKVRELNENERMTVFGVEAKNNYEYDCRTKLGEELEEGVCRIGLITSTKGSRITAVILGRYTLMKLGEDLVQPMRLLYPTDDIVEVKADNIADKVFVRRLEGISSMREYNEQIVRFIHNFHEPKFFLLGKDLKKWEAKHFERTSEILYDDPVDAETRETERRKKLSAKEGEPSAKRRKVNDDGDDNPDKNMKSWEVKGARTRAKYGITRPLRGLEVFCGGGGLSVGLAMSGICHPTIAIDFDKDAAREYARNFDADYVEVTKDSTGRLRQKRIRESAKAQDERTVVFYADVIDLWVELASYEANGRTGQKPVLPLWDDAENAPEFISGGPPCQGFSGANRQKKPEDQKNSLVSVYLSLIDYYKHSLKCGILENVTKLTCYKAAFNMSGQSVIGGIECAVAKHINACLGGLGFSTCWNILGCQHFCVPQHRGRVFLIFTCGGWRLPAQEVPSITNRLVKMHNKIKFLAPNGTSGLKEFTKQGIVPFTIIRQAIDDLAATPTPAVGRAKEEQGRKWETEKETPYQVKPSELLHSEYSAILNGRLDIPIRNHVVKECTHDPARRLERIKSWQYVHDNLHKDTEPINWLKIALPFWPDHMTLFPYKVDCLSETAAAKTTHKYWRQLYGRCDPDSVMPTILTQDTPMGKQGNSLHYEQNRQLSVRELARLQGFPDDYVFDTSEKIKTAVFVIGNSVCPVVASAVGEFLMQENASNWDITPDPIMYFGMDPSRIDFEVAEQIRTTVRRNADGEDAPGARARAAPRAKASARRRKAGSSDSAADDSD